MKELSIDAKKENLDTVMDFICSVLEEGGCPIKLQTSICLSVEELFVNVAHYAYQKEAGKVTIRIEVNYKITIEFEDEGIPFNPLEKEDPDINAAAKDREIGGMGIFMVKQIMDSVEYKRESGKNIVVMSKAVS